MKNMKIKTKLVVSFLLVALLTVIVGAVGIVSVLQMSSQTDLLNRRASIGIAMENAVVIVTDQRAIMRGAALYAALGDLQAARDELDKLPASSALFQSEMDLVDSLIITQETRSRFDEISPARAEYLQARDDFSAVILGTYAEGQLDVAIKAGLADFATHVDGLSQKTTSLAELMEKSTDEQEAYVSQLARTVTIILIIVAVLSAIIAVVLGLYIAGIISSPMVLMMKLMKQVGDTGNFTFAEEDWSKAKRNMEFKDEVAMTTAAFVKMIDQLVYYGKLLQSVAARDLTVDVSTLGAQDTMGTALSDMVDNLNEMFGEINAAASQVSTGSQQIANGAQSLAQGATQQAASVEELSSSITQVSESINKAAASARGAADLANNIKAKAEQGSGQMSAMMEAVREINEASQNISKVIKVIDDIAFQTNILALNAAVEAARAGAAGKGFAVVAEEVRSLAAKSAEAAKDTGSLIENSISRAELGVRIADETNESLKDIVEGILTSSQISNEIAISSDEQSAAIAQINLGIDQVAQVVQQNSATAEESAAASEELSGQSSMLTDLIGQFQLKGNFSGY